MFYVNFMITSRKTGRYTKKLKEKNQRILLKNIKSSIEFSCLQENHFNCKGTHNLKGNGWKKMIHVNVNRKRADVAIIIPDKRDLRQRMSRDKGDYINDKGVNSSKNVTIVNIYAINITALE